MRKVEQASGGPLWVWILVGWLVAGTLAVWVTGVTDLAPEFEVLQEEQELPEDLVDWSPRELRSLPDIGPKLAVEIADRRWAGELDDPATLAVELNLQAVPGIGPKTSAAIQSFLLGLPVPLLHSLPPAARLPGMEAAERPPRSRASPSPGGLGG